MEFLKPNKLKIFLTILLIPFSVLILLYGFGCGFSGGDECLLIESIHYILFLPGVVFWEIGFDFLYPMHKDGFPLSWILSVTWLYFIACLFYFLVGFFYKNRQKLIIRILALLLITFILFSLIPIIVEIIV